MNNDTICAIATPVGGALCVIRVSGGRVREIYAALAGGAPTAGRIRFARLKGKDGETLDEAMCAFFAAPKSYTGEDMLELYTHGGAYVVSAVSERLYGLGARQAEAGEFTRRAFVNGKLDLAQAESVIDVISATSRGAARAALDQLEGKLSDVVSRLEGELIDALSGVDAALDYPDELDEDVYSHLPAALNGVAQRLERLRQDGLGGRVLREGALVTIVGAPNAGKSSLMNALIGRPRAIVTEFAGTTRDVLEEQLSISGIPVRLADTAGLHDAHDPVERIGIERARAYIDKADLLLVSFDSSKPWDGGCEELKSLCSARSAIAVITKSDIGGASDYEHRLRAFFENVCVISALTGEGLDGLKAAIARCNAPPESTLVTNMRHVEAISDALAAVNDARLADEPDCIATDIRAALSALARITGREVDEDVIDAVFSRFCVGK